MGRCKRSVGAGRRSVESSRTPTMAAKRLNKELGGMEAAMAEHAWLAAVGPEGDDMFKWSASIKGPDDSPYAGGTFKLEMTFPPDFPFKPPTVKFLTKMY